MPPPQLRHFKRKSHQELERALDQMPVVAIVGPRQSGKSTLARMIADDHGGRYTTLDRELTRDWAQADPEGFLADHASSYPLVIDEFQKAPRLVNAIKLMVDEARMSGERPTGRFLLTGSADVWASLQISDSLAGRASRAQLWPLSQGEIAGSDETFLTQLFAGTVPKLSDQPIGRGSVANAVVTGGFPEMVLAKDDSERNRWAGSYVEMTLERDAPDMLPRGQHLAELPNLTRLAANRVCALIDTSEIARGMGMSRDTTRRYLRLLEMLHLVENVPAWSGNLSHRLIKAGKLWFSDSGLASHLNGCSAEVFCRDEGALAGALYENFVGMELVKQASFTGQRFGFNHLRTAGGREVDIVIEHPDGRIAGVEVMLTASPSRKAFKGLELLRERLGDRFAGGALIYTGAETQRFGERIWAVPTSALWAASPNRRTT